MAYEVNFGTMRVGASRPVKKSGKFRLAFLGDFSARANRGVLETGEALARRKPLKVDVDNLDATLQRLKVTLRLPLAGDGGAVELPVSSLDDLHPDQLYRNLPLFGELSGLRQRLKTTSTFAKAAKEVQSWSGVKIAPAHRKRPRAAAIPASGKLSDFARLMGTPTAPGKSAVAIGELLKRAVGPHVVPAKDPRQDQLVGAVDLGLAASMRSVLHHPDFQSFESLWRSVDLLVRKLETDEQLQIVLFDITAEEFAADLSKAENLDQTGLYQLLVEQPRLDAAQGAFTAVIANYFFEQTPPHAELLGRIARIVGQTQTAFIAGIGTACLETKPGDLHPLVRESWDALAGISEAAYVGLAVPRFMLRMPYGEVTDPIDSFDFEEFTPQAGLSGILWGHPAVIAGVLLGATFTQQGAAMKPGSVLSLGEMPFYYYTDGDGDQVALPCTERLLNSKMAELVSKHRFMPLLTMKGRPEVRLGGFSSVTGSVLAGPWQPAASGATKPQAAPEAEEKADGSEAPQEPAVEETTAEASTEASDQPAAESDPELDNLLKSLEEPAAATPSEPAAPAADSSEEPEMDPELAKLLKDLG